MSGDNADPAAVAGQPIFCGVDLGAAATKLVLLDGDENVLARHVQHSGVDYAAGAKGALDAALDACGGRAEDVAFTVSTGYGRHNVDYAQKSLTEILCHSVGCFHHVKRAVTVVDIGGQDNKIIHLGPDGNRVNFKMNRKCAAGTGSFIEEIALRLGVPLSDMESLAASTDDAVKLSSFCTVFAKTEILSHLRKGVPVEQVARGAFYSVVTRVVEMDRIDGEVLLTGGVVAHNPTVAELFSKRSGREVIVPPFAQLTGALGAALRAKELYTNQNKEPTAGKTKQGGIDA